MKTWDDLPSPQILELPGFALAVYDSGARERPVVLLIHGFLTSALTWRYVYGSLARRYRVILVDLPGCGASPLPRETSWPASNWFLMLDTLVDALKLDEVVLVGTQMGGSLAAWYGAIRPRTVQKLVILAAGVLGETSANLRLYKLLATPVAGPLIARMFPRELFLKRWAAAHGPTHSLDGAATEIYFNQLRRRGQRLARMALPLRESYGPRFDALEPLIDGLTTPTLLLFGSADKLVPLESGRRFQDLLANSKLIPLSGCGDFPQEECPDLVSKSIIEFLEND